MGDVSRRDAFRYFPDVKRLQCEAAFLKARMEVQRDWLERDSTKLRLVQTLTQGGIRAKFRNLAGNEIAPVPRYWGCPPNWLVSQLLGESRWIQLGNSSEHGFTKLEKPYAPGHMDGYKVLEKNQTPTHILVNGKNLSITDRRCAE